MIRLQEPLKLSTRFLGLSRRTLQTSLRRTEKIVHRLMASAKEGHLHHHRHRHLSVVVIVIIIKSFSHKIVLQKMLTKNGAHVNVNSVTALKHAALLRYFSSWFLICRTLFRKDSSQAYNFSAFIPLKISSMITIRESFFNICLI